MRQFVDNIHAYVVTHRSEPSIGWLRANVPDSLVAENDASADELAAIAAKVLSLAPMETQGRSIVAIDEITSFARAAEVSPHEVGNIARPLNLPERSVKSFIAHIVGEPYVPLDWGGETNDLFTPRVQLGVARVEAAFLLKGSGTRGRLTVAKLGANGDQLVRLGQCPAQLLVVQHVGPVDEAVRISLKDTLLAREARGEASVGSVWDGVDCARLFVAHSLIGVHDGRPTSFGQQILDLSTELRRQER